MPDRFDLLTVCTSRAYKVYRELLFERASRSQYIDYGIDTVDTIVIIEHTAFGLSDFNIFDRFAFHMFLVQLARSIVGTKNAREEDVTPKNDMNFYSMQMLSV